MITKENYEIWMIDQMDGTLSQSDEQALMQFLKEHPELNSDCSDLNKYTLKPASLNFEAKNNLLKTEADVIGIPQEDYEAISALEQGSASDSKLAIAYKKVILKPDTNLRFQEKEKLKRALVLPFFNQQTMRRIAVAASIAILFIVGAIPFLEQGEIENHIAVITQPKVENTTSYTTYEAQQIEINENRKESSEVKVSAKGEKALVRKTVQNSFVAKGAGVPKKIIPMGIKPLETPAVNAYEIGLNSIMPFMIMRQLTERQYYEELAYNKTQIESEKLSKKAQTLANGAKLINFLSGDKTTIKKYMNEDGQLIAYEVESDGMSFIRKVKSNNIASSN